VWAPGKRFKSFEFWRRCKLMKNGRVKSGVIYALCWRRVSADHKWSLVVDNSSATVICGVGRLSEKWWARWASETDFVLPTVTCIMSRRPVCTSKLGQCERSEATGAQRASANKREVGEKFLFSDVFPNSGSATVRGSYRFSDNCPIDCS